MFGAVRVTRPKTNEPLRYCARVCSCADRAQGEISMRPAFDGQNETLLRECHVGNRSHDFQRTAIGTRMITNRAREDMMQLEIARLLCETGDAICK